MIIYIYYIYISILILSLWNWRSVAEFSFLLSEEQPQCLCESEQVSGQFVHVFPVLTLFLHSSPLSSSLF